MQNFGRSCFNMLTDNKLGIGDFVLIKDKGNNKYIIVSEKDKNLFEVMQIKTGEFIKVQRTNCRLFKLK